jgi:hypothetical protein
VAVVAAGALLLAGGAVAVADAAHAGKGKGKLAKKAQVAKKRIVRAGVHADVSLVRADGSTDAFSVDRGTVTASSATSVTLHRADGKDVTFSLSTATVARGTVTVGKPALVFSRNGAAFRVRAPGARLAPAITAAVAGKKSPIVHIEASFVRGDGTTGTVALDRGQVTASSTTSLTLHRADGKDVTFTLGTGVVVRGRLAAGGKALVLSRDGAVVRVLARGPKVAG